MELDWVKNEKVRKYFEELQSKTFEMHKLANEARVNGYDPESYVDIPLAANVSQRVEALISSEYPQITGSGVAERIDELEEKYPTGDLRIALILAAEIAEQKFCKFSEEIQAISAGVRTGFAYITQGVVSAPLEGLIDVKFKKRKDGKNYLALYYAGPIRGGGATASAMTLVIADYVRQKKGIDSYDPTETDIARFHTEVNDYYERVERKQYLPSEEEMKFLISHVDVEIDGDTTARLEVSNHKNLDRVSTNQIRGGLALMLTDALPLKANKVWKHLQKWHNEFGLVNGSLFHDF